MVLLIFLIMCGCTLPFILRTICECMRVFSVLIFSIFYILSTGYTIFLFYTLYNHIYLVCGDAEYGDQCHRVGEAAPTEWVELRINSRVRRSIGETKANISSELKHHQIIIFYCCMLSIYTQAISKKYFEPRTMVFWRLVSR